MSVRQSPTVEALAEALSEAQKDFEAVPKKADNPFFRSKYADLPTIVQAATPILAKYGLSVTQLLDFDGENDLLTTRLMHASGQWIQSEARLHIRDAKGNLRLDPQGLGSAVTYYRRYAYSAILGIVTEEDDDGNKSSSQAAERPPKAQPARPTAAREARNGDEAKPMTGPIRKALDTAIASVEGWAENPDEVLAYLSTTLGKEVSNIETLTYDEAKKAIQAIQELVKGK
jgi:hypothetical protein